MEQLWYLQRAGNYGTSARSVSTPGLGTWAWSQPQPLEQDGEQAEVGHDEPRPP